MAEPLPAPLRAEELCGYATWVGRTEHTSELVAAAPLAGWFATLDRDVDVPVTGDILPPLAHWLYFLPRARQSQLGADGHAARGGFLPPVRLPRRMWAGGRIDWHEPLRIGDVATRTSRIHSVEHKKGRSGDLIFVTVEHVIQTAGRLALREQHDIVYRSEPSPRPNPSHMPSGKASQWTRSAPMEVKRPADWTRQIEPSEALLFRYSALTFNGHRIHYDRRYVTEVEGYPGLVVHGPLIATFLVDAARQHFGDLDLSHFEFRALSPLFDTAPFTVAGRIAEIDSDTQSEQVLDLWSCDAAGELSMTASARRASTPAGAPA